MTTEPASTGEDAPFAFSPEQDGTLSLEAAVGQAIGAASMCWESTTSAGVFDSTRAKSIVDAVMARIREDQARAANLLYEGWAVIANVGVTSHGGWSGETPQWQHAAARWRDAFHDWLAEHNAGIQQGKVPSLADLEPKHDPDRPCAHEDQNADVAVHKMVDDDQNPNAPIVGFRADIKVNCARCGDPFIWNGCLVGVPAGNGPPRVSLDGTELRAVLRPASAPPDFGAGMPGFGVQVLVPDAAQRPADV